MSDSPLISRKSELLEAEVDGELVALHVDNGTCYGFNGTATRIWALIEQPRTLAELCDALTAEFEVDRGDCEREVTILLRELEEDGLVDISGSLSPDSE